MCFQCGQCKCFNVRANGDCLARVVILLHQCDKYPTQKYLFYLVRDRDKAKISVYVYARACMCVCRIRAVIKSNEFIVTISVIWERLHDA